MFQYFGTVSSKIECTNRSPSGNTRLVIDEQLYLQNFLRARFFELQSKNPSYSLRAFSKKLGLSPSAASEVLRGQRRVSRKIAERISARLLLDPQEQHKLLKGFTEKTKRPNLSTQTDTVSKDYLKLTADQFHLISEWAHYGILSLMKTRDYVSSVSWIAERLGITENKTSQCIERLLRLGLIEKNSEDRWIRTYSAIHTPDDVFSTSLQKAHIADMELAKQALQTLPVTLRDFTSISVPTSPSLLPRAKALIRKFRSELTELLESEPGTEVYQASIYLYPLTKVRKGTK